RCSGGPAGDAETGRRAYHADGAQPAAPGGPVLPADPVLRKGRPARGHRRGRKAWRDGPREPCRRHADADAGASLRRGSAMARTTGNPDRPSRFAILAVVAAGLLVLAAGGLLALAFRETPQGAAGTVLASAIGGPVRLID